MEIPNILIDHIRDGQVVLFLGSGASIGANHPEGIEPPIGSKLAGILAEKFLDYELKKRPLEQVAELAISETGLFEVQSFIAEIFNGFTPADFHKTIPTFKWAAIATTNYDLIIEKAYNDVQEKLQNLIVFKKNGERVEEKLKSFDNVVYLKLHGCITNIADQDTPLVLTPEQYITHREGRSRLFERLQSLAYEFPILFVGHSLADSDLRIILYELSQLKEAKPRSYILTPKMTSPEKRFWETKKFTCLESTFEGFVHELDQRIPTQLRSLAKFKTEVEHPIFNKFAVPESIRPSESLLTLLSRDIEYIHKGYKTADIDPNAFYRGFFQDLSPIVHELDVRRAITDDILLEVFLESEIAREQVQFFVIKGHAGSGKSVLLRRLAWEASVDFDKLCLLANSNSQIGYESLYELHRLTKERLFLFIDPVTEHQSLIEILIEKARKDKFPLTILSAERHNEWNTECEALVPYLTDNYDVEYLQPKEIESLVHLLTKYDSLGHLKGLKFEHQVDALSKKAGRQLLVALHEATLGKLFSDIILDEYHSITSPEAQSLYLTVCILHRLGVYTRAGLISRVHGIPFSIFKDKLFKPLEFIVFASRDELIKDYYYRARHSHIAEMVFERVLVEQQDRFDEYVRLIDNLDIDYKSDREAFKGLMNARQLLQLFQDPQEIRQLFSAANERVRSDPKLMQQEAILEMNLPDGNLNRATELLESAHSVAPHDKAIAHSLSVLALNKANKAATELEKSKLRKESRKIAYQLISQGAITSHPYHTLIKIGLDELSDLMKQVDDQTVIERKIKEVEKVISEAIQAFPDSSFLLDEEAKFSELVEKYPKAIESLERAFKANKRSPYIASRLARTYENEGKTDKAIQVLKECLDANPSDKFLNYRLAILLMKQTDAKGSDIKHHLRRSFTQGDSNYAAQFWYARLLYLEGELTEATEHFQRLSHLKIDVRIKKEPRGIVKDGEDPIRCSGTITQMESSYGFLVRDGENDSFFTHFSFSDGSVWKNTKSQDRVTFEIGFNYHGPVALNIRPEK